MQDILDFSQNKVVTLTEQQLKRTVHPKNAAQEPLGGIFHYQLIDEIQERANKHDLNIAIWEMFAAQNNDKYLPGVIINDQLSKQYGDYAVEACQLNRLFCNCQITNFDDKDYTTNIAIAYHQKGIQVAVGSNVKICHNQMVLGTKDFYVATYSDRGNGKKASRANMPTPQQLLDIVEGYFDQIGDRVYEQRKRIEEMKNVVLTLEQIYIFIGMLQCMRVAMDSNDSRIRQQGVYPLGNTQLNSFTSDIMIRHKTQERVTLWDMYDSATNLYKAATSVYNTTTNQNELRFGMEIPNILPQNYAMAEFIEDWQGKNIIPATKSIIIENV